MSVSPDCQCGTPGCEHQAEGVPCKCLKGYEHTTVSGGCQDIDECQVYYGVCLENNTCVNEEGKYRCVCGNENHVLYGGLVCGENFEQHDKEQEDNRDKNEPKTWNFPESPAALAAEFSLSLIVIVYITYICVQNIVLVMVSINTCVTTDPVLTDDDESDVEKCKMVDLAKTLLLPYDRLGQLVSSSTRIDNGDDKEQHDLIHGNPGVNTALSSVDVLGGSISKFRQPISNANLIENGADEEHHDFVHGTSNVMTALSKVFSSSAITRFRRPSKPNTVRSLERIESSPVDDI